MKKRYVLLTKTLSKYDGMERYNYKLFNDYFELQRHLQNYWFVEKNRYVIFEETDFKKDYSINDVKRGIR